MASLFVRLAPLTMAPSGVGCKPRLDRGDFSDGAKNARNSPSNEHSANGYDADCRGRDPTAEANTRNARRDFRYEGREEPDVRPTHEFGVVLHPDRSRPTQHAGANPPTTVARLTRAAM